MYGQLETFKYIQMKQYFLLTFFLLQLNWAFAQAPNINYPQNKYVFEIGQTMNSILPTNTGGYIAQQPGSGNYWVNTLHSNSILSNNGNYNDTSGFNYPQDVAVDKLGNLFVTDFGNNCIKKINKNGEVTVFAGSGVRGDADGLGRIAEFNDPIGITFDNGGNLLVADAGNNKIKKISPTGLVTTVASSFNYPNNMDVDAIGNIYVADTKNNQIKKIDTSGNVTVVASTAYAVYYFSGPGASLSDNPIGVAVAPNGEIYFIDRNRLIRKITNYGVTLYSGSLQYVGSHDDIVQNAYYFELKDIEIDYQGNIYVSQDNSALRMIPNYGYNVTRTLMHGDWPTENKITSDGSYYGGSQGRVATRGICLDSIGAVYCTEKNDFFSNTDNNSYRINKIRRICKPFYEINPPLPQGLSFDVVSGKISGKPETVTTLSNYLVSVSNSYGSSSFMLNIETAFKLKIDPIHPSSNFISKSTFNYPIAAFKVENKNFNLTLNEFSLQVKGNFQASDINNFKLYINKVNSLSGATQIGNTFVSNSNNSIVSFSAFNQNLEDSTIYYLIVTADVSKNTTNGTTLEIAPIPNKQFVFTTNVVIDSPDTLLGKSYTIIENTLCSNDTTVATVNLPANSLVRATTYYSNIYLFNQNNKSNAYKYNVNDRKYTAIADKPTPCIECGVAEANGKIYCFNTNSTTQAYDIASNTWQTTTNQPSSSTSSVYAASINNKVFVLGTNNNNQNIFTQYNPFNNTYTAQATPNQQTSQSRLVAYNNLIYKIGGINNTSNNTTSTAVEVYNPSNNTWTSLPDLPEALSHVGATNYDNKLYVFGGKQSNTNPPSNLSNSNKVYVFDIAGNTWYAQSNTLNFQRANIEAKTANGLVYLFGGTDTSNTTTKQAVRYFCKDQLCTCKWAEYVCNGQTSENPCPTSSLYRPGTVFCNGYATKVVEVTNPITGKTWMDRNLGASRAATSSTDTLAYGDLYQWGRGADGHQCRNSTITSTLSSTDQPGHGNFIITNSYPWDWRMLQNDKLWQEGNGINNPCPTGYRLPTSTELEAERISWSQNNYLGAFGALLKLPVAGCRVSVDGSLSFVGSYGYYWSSTKGTPTSILDFGSGGASLDNFGGRAFGFSVRCIKD